MEGLAVGRQAVQESGEKKRDAKAKRKNKLSDLLNLNLKKDEGEKGGDALADFIEK